MDTNQPARRSRRVRTLIMLAFAVSAVVWTAVSLRGSGTRKGNAEYEWFKAKYGPSRNSEHAEEWLVRDFFGDQRGGTFVDVGSFHYRTFNNTYYLDQTLGWSGLAIDAQEEFAADYAKHRPRTKFFSFFVSDRSDTMESLFVPVLNKLVASSNKSFSDRYDPSGRERKVQTITLTDLLDRNGLKTIDFMSMDIELAEPKALAGFDIERFKPRLVVVEAHSDIRQQLLDYFASHKYRVVGRYLRADPFNLWFAPADAPAPEGVHAGHSH
jgi:FkbM family methyltransferase